MRTIRALFLSAGVALLVFSIPLFLISCRGGDSEEKSLVQPPAETQTPELPQSTTTAGEKGFTCPTFSMGTFGLALFREINNQRARYSIVFLAPHGCVIYVAQMRSNDMASRGYFSHTSPEGETAFSLLDSYRVPHGWAGENLAKNNYPDSDTVRVAIRDLMASEGHRANILSTNYSQMGVAVAFDGAGMKYYTMIFVGPP
ncbi:CAP domain-containing protein [Patescibacteria group bacterium]